MEGESLEDVLDIDDISWTWLWTSGCSHPHTHLLIKPVLDRGIHGRVDDPND